MAARVPTTELMNPPARVIARLTREVLTAKAAEYGMPFLDFETRYKTTSSALVHLYYHTQFRSPIHDRIGAVVEATRRFLSHPDARRVIPPLQIRELERVEMVIKKWSDRALEKENMDRDRVREYIEVCDALRAACLEEGFDASRAIDPMIYTQANMIVDNFQAYDRTLNEK